MKLYHILLIILGVLLATGIIVWRYRVVTRKKMIDHILRNTTGNTAAMFENMSYEEVKRIFDQTQDRGIPST